MKFLSFALTFVALLLAEHSVNADFECPKPNEVPGGCVCYPELSSMICSNLKETDQFDLEKPREMEKLVFRDIEAFPFIGENLHTKKNKLTVKSLVILHNNDKNLSLPSVYDLENACSVSSESLKVLSNNEIKATLDMSKTKAGFKSLTIENVNSLKGFDFNNFPDLTHLVLRNVQFKNEVEKQLLDPTNLKYLEITENKGGLTELWSFRPKICNSSDRIYIKLNNNDKLAYFDFSKLFDVSNRDDCSYRIELNDNPALKEDILTRQIAQSKTKNAAKLAEQKLAIKKITDEGRFFLVMHDSPVKCSCALRQIYLEYKPYLHSISCKTTTKDVFTPLVKFEEKPGHACH